MTSVKEYAIVLNQAAKEIVNLHEEIEKSKENLIDVKREAEFCCDILKRDYADKFYDIDRVMNFIEGIDLVASKNI